MLFCLAFAGEAAAQHDGQQEQAGDAEAQGGDVPGVEAGGDGKAGDRTPAGPDRNGGRPAFR